MNTTAYLANYNSALALLKANQKDLAMEALRHALSQVPEEEKVVGNAAYLSIAAVLSFLLLEERKSEESLHLVDKALAVKGNHADLLFVKSLLLFDAMRFDEVLEAVVNYFLAMNDSDADMYGYQYTHEGVLREIYGTILPEATMHAVHVADVKRIAQRLSQVTGSALLRKAYDVMESSHRQGVMTN